MPYGDEKLEACIYPMLDWPIEKSGIFPMVWSLFGPLYIIRYIFTKKKFYKINKNH
jgi:hypothetical protein